MFHFTKQCTWWVFWLNYFNSEGILAPNSDHLWKKLLPGFFCTNDLTIVTKKPPKIFHYQNNWEICQRDFFRWSGTLSDKTLKLENDFSNFSALKPSLWGELQNFEAKHEQLFPISLRMKIFLGYEETVVQKNRGNIYFHGWFTWLTLTLPWINWINKLWTVGTNQTPHRSSELCWAIFCSHYNATCTPKENWRSESRNQLHHAGKPASEPKATGVTTMSST